VNALLGAPLDSNGVLLAALVAEERVAGRHGDNLAAALHGGIVIVRSLEPPDVIRLAVPDELRVVVAHPDQRMNTREGRAVVPASFPRETLVWQAAQVAALVAGLSTSDYALISRALGDRVAEPYRAPLLPGFAEARAAALASGALGASISGSGPTSFALVRGDAAGQRVAAAMAAAYEAMGVRCEARVSRVAGGARLNSGR
jgi:homoserine kinase